MGFKAIILTPIKCGDIIPPCDLGFPRLVFQFPTLDYRDRKRSIAVCRAALQQYYARHLARTYDGVFLIDSDVVTDKATLEALIKKWEPGKTPCVNTKGGATGHIVASCCFLSRDDFLGVDFLESPDSCHCEKLPQPFYIDREATEVKYGRQRC